MVYFFTANDDWEGWVTLGGIYNNRQTKIMTNKGVGIEISSHRDIMF